MSEPVEHRRVPTARVDRDERPAAREGDRLPVGRPRRLERVLGRERHPAKPLPVDADHEDLESSRLLFRRERDRLPVGRPGGPVGGLGAGRQAPHPRAVRVHDPELPDLGARQAARVGDPPAVGRPRGLDLRCQVLRHATRAGPVGAHDVDVIAVLVALIGDPRAVRRPRGLGLVAVGRRHAAGVRAVGVHHVDVERPGAGAREGDPGAVRREVRIDLEGRARRARRVAVLLGEPALIAPVGAHAVQRVVAVARRDEHDVVPVRAGAAASAREQEARRRASAEDGSDAHDEPGGGQVRTG